jgi:hypothetical protein
MIIEIQIANIGNIPVIVSEAEQEAFEVQMQDTGLKFVRIEGRNKVSGASSTLIINKDQIVFCSVVQEDVVSLAIPSDMRIRQ